MQLVSGRLTKLNWLRVEIAAHSLALTKRDAGRDPTMQGEVYSIYHLSIQPAQFSSFQELISRIVAAASKERDTFTYEYVVSDDHSTVHILERYRAAGVLPHVEETFAPFADEFLSLAKIDELFVYGEPSAEIRAKLDGFGAIYLRPFAGFTR